jgi:hypothetical protein
LSHYLIGNAASSPESRIETYSYVLTPISVLNICLHTLVSKEKKDDNAPTTLAVDLIYGWDRAKQVVFDSACEEGKEKKRRKLHEGA